MPDIPDTIDKANQLAQQNSVNSLLALGFIALIVVMGALIFFMYRIIKILNSGNNTQATNTTIVDLAQTITATSTQNAHLLERMATTQESLVRMQAENQTTVAAFTELTRVTVQQQGEFSKVIEGLGTKYAEIAGRFAYLDSLVGNLNQKATEQVGHFGEVGTRLDELDDKMDGNGKTIQDVLEKIKGMEKSLNDLKKEVASPHDLPLAITEKLTAISAELAEIKDLLKGPTREPSQVSTEEKKDDG